MRDGRTRLRPTTWIALIGALCAPGAAEASWFADARAVVRNHRLEASRRVVSTSRRYAQFRAYDDAHNALGKLVAKHQAGALDEQSAWARPLPQRSVSWLTPTFLAPFVRFERLSSVSGASLDPRNGDWAHRDARSSDGSLVRSVNGFRSEGPEQSVHTLKIKTATGELSIRSEAGRAIQSATVIERTWTTPERGTSTLKLRYTPSTGVIATVRAHGGRGETVTLPTHDALGRVGGIPSLGRATDQRAQAVLDELRAEPALTGVLFGPQGTRMLEQLLK